MEEKYMVNDILENNKFEILLFTNSLVHTENLELRQTLSQLRSKLESFDSELFTLAVSKGYYYSTPQSKPEEIAQAKNLLI
ncbi:MAG: spore coat protein [Clostridia bacterium]|nr:spore coat protein [Clostridia bacterium]